MSRNDNLLLRHKQMLQFQKEIAPFTPTTRELMELWGYNATSAVSYTLHVLLAAGLVIARSNGSYSKYFAVRKAKSQ